MVIIREVGRADNKVSSLNLCKEEWRRREGGEGEREEMCMPMYVGGYMSLCCL